MLWCTRVPCDDITWHLSKPGTAIKLMGDSLRSFGPVKSTEKSKALGMSKVCIILSLGITYEFRKIN